MIWTQPVLRALAACGVTANLFVNLYLTVYAIFAIRELGFSVARFGALASASGVGGLLGALVAARVARRLGIGPTLVGAHRGGAMVHLLPCLPRGPGEDVHRLAAEALALASDLAREATAEGIQIHRSAGFLETAEVQRYYRHAAVEALLLGRPTQLRAEAAALLAEEVARRGARVAQEEGVSPMPTLASTL